MIEDEPPPKPDEGGKLDMPCPLCTAVGNASCGICHGRGEWPLTEKPGTMIGDADMAQFLFAADQAKHGRWPADGGWLSQCASLLDGVKLFWRLGGA